MPIFGRTDLRWTYQFFHDDLGLIPNQKSKVHAAFEKYSLIHGETLKLRFVPRYLPYVKLANLDGQLGYTPPTGDEIQLNATFIDELETELPAAKVPRGRSYAPSEFEEKVLLILETTVLHELVHWSRRKYGETVMLNYRSTRGLGFEEAVARQFEKEAYGMTNNVHTLGIARLMPRTAKL